MEDQPNLSGDKIEQQGNFGVGVNKGIIINNNPGSTQSQVKYPPQNISRDTFGVSTNNSVQKILILAANPRDTSPLRLDEEVREIDEGLKRSRNRDKFELEHKWAVRTRDFRRHILEIKPQIVHFSGHGEGEEGIILEDSMGYSSFVKADALANFFRLFAKKGLECVLLNACYSEIQAKAISQHVNYVVGMNNKIGDSAAIEFTVAFYDSLGAGESIDFAYELGCSSIQLQGIPEHLTPVLYKQGELIWIGESEKKQVTPTSPKTEYVRSLESKLSKTRSPKNIPKPESNKSFVRQFSVKNSKSKVLNLKVFNFDTVKLDSYGEEVQKSCQQGEYFTENLDEKNSLDMVVIPAASFMMGATEKELGKRQEETPQHLVKVKSFLMSKYPITQAQWKIVASFPKVNQDLKPSPSYYKGKDRPVEQVSWHDAVEFCHRLSVKTGNEYRLPTEAEWEYACRAGSKTPFHFGETIDSRLANYDGKYKYGLGRKGTYRKKTTSVEFFSYANEFGLFDMHGNVWEWCLDNWHESYENAPNNSDAWLDKNDQTNRVIRGGSWKNDPLLCRSAYRQYSIPTRKFKDSGFRVVLPLLTSD